MTVRRRALAGLGVSIAVMAASYGSAFLPGGAPGWAPWGAAVAIPGALVSTMILGAARDGSVGRLAWPFAFVFVVLAGGFCLALAVGAAEPGEGRLWMGLPAGAAVILYVVGFLPLAVVPVAYALTFDELTLRDGDWERIRRQAAGLPGPGPAGLAGGDGAATTGDGAGDPASPADHAGDRVPGEDRP